MYVVIFNYFKKPLVKKDVQDLVSQRLFNIQRFRSKLVSDATEYVSFWTTDKKEIYSPKLTKLGP